LSVITLTLPGLGFFENLKAGGDARNLKFGGIVVATDRRFKKLMLNKQWLPWLSCDVISKCQNLQNTI